MAVILKDKVFSASNGGEVKFIDTPRILARYSADLIMGQGLTISSENEAIDRALKDFKKRNKLDTQLLQIVEEVKYTGRVIITIDKRDDGELYLSFQNNELLQNVEKIDITPFKARLLIKKVVGFRVFFMTAIYDTEKVVRNITISKEGGIQADYITGVNKYDDEALPKEFTLPLVEYHNLGFVPFVEITNRGSINKIQTIGDYSNITDFAPVKELDNHINHGLRQLYKEEILGKTRGYGMIDETQLKQWKESGYSPAYADFFIKTIPTGDNQTKPFEVVGGTYDGMKWIEPTKEKINMFFNMSGWSAPFKIGSNQTEAESLLTKDYDMRSMKAQRRIYTEMLNDLIMKYLCYKGLIPNLDVEKPFKLEIKENVIYNKQQLGQFLIANIQGGLMTTKEAIMVQRDIDDEAEADEILKSIEKEQTEKMEKETEQLVNIQGGNMGVNKDSDPLGKE